MIGLPQIYLLCWHLWGKEKIIITVQSFVLQRSVLGYTRSKYLKPKNMHRLRYVRINQPLLRTEWTFWHLSGGPIAFDHANDTFGFGRGVSKNEAIDILNSIRDEFPYIYEE